MARSSSKNSSPASLFASWRKRSESERTRSTTRPSLVDVERIIVPLAEIKTAGVIIAVKTASDEVRVSTMIYEYILATAKCRSQFGMRRLDAAFFVSESRYIGIATGSRFNLSFDPLAISIHRDSET